MSPAPTRRIVDWGSFHGVFAEALGFPDFYGRNMNAADFASRCPEQYSVLVECAVFVN